MINNENEHDNRSRSPGALHTRPSRARQAAKTTRGLRYIYIYIYIYTHTHIYPYIHTYNTYNIHKCNIYIYIYILCYYLAVADPRRPKDFEPCARTEHVTGPRFVLQASASIIIIIIIIMISIINIISITINIVCCWFVCQCLRLFRDIIVLVNWFALSAA